MPPLTPQEACELLEQAFVPYSAQARLRDHGELIELRIFNTTGVQVLEVESVPRDQIASTETLETLVASVRAALQSEA